MSDSRGLLKAKWRDLDSEDKVPAALGLELEQKLNFSVPRGHDGSHSGPVASNLLEVRRLGFEPPHALDGPGARWGAPGPLGTKGALGPLGLRQSA